MDSLKVTDVVLCDGESSDDLPADYIKFLTIRNREIARVSLAKNHKIAEQDGPMYSYHPMNESPCRRCEKCGCCILCGRGGKWAVMCQNGTVMCACVRPPPIPSS